MASTTLNFTLLPEAVVRLHDIVVCLGRFSESVSIEARRNRVCHHTPPFGYTCTHSCLSQLSLTALNSSKSAYASFTLDSQVFFSKYHFTSSHPNQTRPTGLDGRFTCQLYNKVRPLAQIGGTVG